MNTLYSVHHEADLHLGKLPARPPESRHAVWAELRRPLVAAGTLPKAPPVFGHGNDFTDWKMLGNGPCDDNSIPQAWAAYQGAGNCGIAWPCHALMEADKDAGAPVTPFTSMVAINNYAAYTAHATPGQGYDPETGANDSGVDLQGVITWLQETGLTDVNAATHKIGPSVVLTPGDLSQLWECAYIFENVDTGWVLAQAQEDQFNAGQPWDYVPGSPQIGGHNAGTVGHPVDRNGALITWALRKEFTAAFFTNQNDESYSWADLARINRRTGKTYEHFSEVDIEEFIRLEAQAKARALGLI